MALLSGTRLGPYEILSPLGQGGMGEVYRARDTNLQRDVAIKVLPEALAFDADRAARFQREAKVLASLNHPNIAAIHGLDESDGRRALVMELVEGLTLAEIIAQSGESKDSPLPIADALSIARQIASALEAAHDKGIVHRDLKPANVKVRPDGTVKVLDFGLAKLTQPGSGHETSGVAFTHSPTLSVQATLAGVILGTAAYMSPEQARGKPVDQRADIWAFGCVLFEMLAGRRTFDVGETISDAVASILKNDPDWNALPAETPPNVRTLIRRCLQKDPQKRLPHIGLVRIELEEGETTPASVEAGLQTRLPTLLWKIALPAAAAAIAGGLIVGTAMWSRTPVAVPPTVTRFIFPLPQDQRFTDRYLPSVAVSPDGTRVAYVANRQLFVKSMSELGSRPVPGTAITEGFLGGPVFAPDGRSLAYWHGTAPTTGTLKRVAVEGGTPITISPIPYPFGLSWTGNDILIGRGGAVTGPDSGVFRVAATGGSPQAIVATKSDEVALGPILLPDNDSVLFTLLTGVRAQGDFTAARWDAAQVVLHSLKNGTRSTLVQNASEARYLPTGHVVYVNGTTLFAVPFDVRRRSVTGGPVPVLENLARAQDVFVSGSGQFSVSNGGTLVYLEAPPVSAPGQFRVALIDRQGMSQPLNVPPGSYEYPRVSPDGKRIAVGVDAGRESNIWIYDLSGASALRQLTFGGKNRFPVWSADGSRVTFQSDREGDRGIFSQQADGAAPAERLTKPEQGVEHAPEAWSPDGKTLLFSSVKTGNELWMLSVQDRKTTPFGDVRSIVVQSAATFSPDGRWVAYASGDPSSIQSFVQPFPPTGAKYLIGPGIQPFWSPDGKELFLKLAQGSPLVAMKVTTQGGFALGNQMPVLNASPFPYRIRGPNGKREADITKDGRHFVGVVAVGPAPANPTVPSQIQVVLNWFEEVKQRAGK